MIAARGSPPAVSASLPAARLFSRAARRVLFPGSVRAGRLRRDHRVSATTTATAMTMPVISGQIELAADVADWPSPTFGTPTGRVRGPIRRGFLVNSTAKGVTSAATASRTPTALAHHGMFGRQGSSSSSRFTLRWGRAEAMTITNAMTASPSAADSAMARTVPLAAAAVWLAPWAKVPRARSPVTVTASRTATAATRRASAARRPRAATSVRGWAGRGVPGRIAVPLRSDPLRAPGRRGSSAFRPGSAGPWPRPGPGP